MLYSWLVVGCLCGEEIEAAGGGLCEVPEMRDDQREADVNL